MDLEDFGEFVGQLVVAIIYTVIACIFCNLQAAFGVLFCIGIFFIAISANLMMDHNGVGRAVVFCIGLAFLIIPSFIQNILVIKSQSGTLIEICFFAMCAGLALAEWLICGYTDFYYYMLNFIVWGGIILFALIIKAIAKSVYVTSIILLILGIIALIIMFIFRITKGSALTE